MHHSTKNTEFKDSLQLTVLLNYFNKWEKNTLLALKFLLKVLSVPKYSSMAVDAVKAFNTKNKTDKKPILHLVGGCLMDKHATSPIFIL